MKNFIKLILVFTLVFLSSMPVYATESTSLSMEDLDTVLYEGLLTEFYGVEEGYAYCSVAVNITSDTALTEAVTIGIPEAVGTNVWRVSTELTGDSNVSAVQYNNSYYYLYPVLNPEFTDEGVSFQTDELGIFIAGGCFDNETLESFSSGTSNFNINESNTTPSTRTEWVVEGVIYRAEDAIITDADTTQSFLGINYWIFEDGMCILDGVQTKDSDFNSTNEPWRLYNDKVNTVYDNHDCNGYKQNGMYEVYGYTPVVKKVIFGEDYNSASVTSFQNMFYEYSGSTLKYVDISNMFISNSVNDSIWNYDCVFLNCNNLNTIVTPRYNACSSIKLPKTMYSYPDNTAYTTLPVTNGESITLYDKALPEDGTWLGAKYGLLDTDGDGVKETCYVYGTMTDNTVVKWFSSSPNYKTYGFYKVLTDNPKVTKAIVNCSLGSRTSTYALFYECNVLTSLEFGTNFDTSNVTDMAYMLYECSSLASLDVSNFNTSNVVDMAYMFDSCSKLTSLDLSNFNTHNVTSMFGMFSYCSALTSLNVSNFNTSNVTSMCSMFDRCSSLKTLDVSNFNTSKVTNMSGMFEYCSKLTSLNISNFVTSNVTRMSTMFCSCSSLISLDISNFDTSNVTSIFSMFDRCSSLTSLDLSSFDTRNIKNMKSMFYGCKSLTSLNLRNFNTCNVTDMSSMFEYCSKLNSLNLSSFNTSKVTNMASMFSSCSGLTLLDLSSFNTSEVTTMDGIFDSCSGLTSLDVSNFDTSKVTSMRSMFDSCSKLAYLDLSNFNTSKVTNMYAMFWGCNSLTSLDLSNFDTSKVTDMSHMFYKCRSLTSLDISNFNTSNVTDMYSMFEYCSKLTSLNISNFNTSNVTSYNFMFKSCNELETLKTPNTNSIEGITLPKSMYDHENSNTEYTTLPVTNGTSMTLYALPKDGEWLGAPYYLRDDDGDGVKETCYVYGTMTDTTDLTNSNYKTLGFYSILTEHPDITKAIINCSLGSRVSAHSLFDSCSNLISLEFGNNFDTDNITDMVYMFRRCSSLTSLNVSNFSTSNVLKLYGMFNQCSSLTSLDLSNFNTSNVDSMSGMFEQCRSLTSLDLSNFDTSNVTNMSCMFYECRSLTSLDLSNFNTSKVTTMGSMLLNCGSLTSLDLSNFNTSNVTDMSRMFIGCASLVTLDVHSFDTSHVTNMYAMFKACKLLTSLDLSNFNTVNVTSMSNMFCDCNSLTSLDLSNFDTSNVTAMDSMLVNCRSLTSLDISNFDTSNVSNMSYMFSSCSSLTLLDVSNFNTSNVTKTPLMFRNCSSLTYLDISSFNMSSVTSYAEMFDYCNKIETLKTPHTNPIENINLSKSMYTHPDNTAYTKLPVTTGTSLTLHDKEFKLIAEGNEYNIADSLTSWDISLNENGSVMAYLFDTDADSVGDTVVLNGVGETVGFDARVKNDTQIYGSGPYLTVNDRGFGYKGSSNYYAAPWTFPQYKDNVKHFYFTDNSNVAFGNANYLFYNMSKLESIKFDKASFSNVTSMHDMFYGCSSLTSLDLSNFNTSNVTSMSGMFSNCRNLTALDLSEFDTSKVTNMSGMFRECRYLTSLDLSNFDTSNVTNMSYMFYWCSKLTSLDLSNFNTSNVTAMPEMFDDCYSLTSLDLSNFNTCNVTDMDSMFKWCSSLTSLDLSNFNTSNVTAMCVMFAGCSALQTLDVSNFDTSKVTNMGSMFYNCSSLTSLDVSNFNTSNVVRMFNMFAGCTRLTSLGLSNFDTSKVIDMKYMFGDCSSLTSLSLSNFNTSNVTDMGRMFSGCSSLTELDLSSFDMSLVTAASDMFSNCSKIETLKTPKTSSIEGVTLPKTMYDHGNSNAEYTTLPATTGASLTLYYLPKDGEWLGAPYCLRDDDEDGVKETCYVYGTMTDTTVINSNNYKTYGFYKVLASHSDVTRAIVNCSLGSNTSAQSLFYKCNVLTSLEFGTNFNTSNITNMCTMFFGCSSLTSLNLSSFVTSQVTNMGSMFNGCNSLTVLNTSNFITSNVTDMNGMFAGCNSLTSLDVSNFNTSNVTNMNNMFAGCKKVTSLDLRHFNTSNVTSMQSIFYGCNALNTLDISNFDTSKVTAMSSMFAGCSSLASLNLSSFDTSKVTNMDSMFYGDKFTSLDLSNFNTSNVTSMYNMFYFCDKLTSLNLSNFSTSNVTNMCGMFDGCSALQTLDISNFDTSSVTNMCSMFYGCSKLTSLDLSNFDTSNATSMNSMFCYCRLLTTLYLSNFNTSNVTDMNSMFYGCSSLTSLNLSNFDTTNVTNMFQMFMKCSSLTHLNVSSFNTSKVTNMGSIFNNCSSITSLDLSSFDMSLVTNTTDMFVDCTPKKIMLPESIGSTDVTLNTTYYGYASDDSVPDSKVTYTKLLAKNPETGLTYLSTKEYPASESILRTCNNATYFLNIENVSFTRNKIKSVNFVVNSDITADSVVSGATYGPVDVSYGGKGALCAYSKVSSANANAYDIYIVAKFDRIYLNSDVDGGGNSLFKDITQCSNLNGIEYLDTSRATCMSNMFKNFYSAYTREVEMENKLFFHTSNLDDAGNGSNGYGSNLSNTYDISIPNASSLSITITYQTQNKFLGSYTDYVCIYPYSVTPSSSNHSSSITGALYGTTKTTKTFKIEDNKAKIYFKSNRTSNNYYGFYAVVTGFSGEGDPITLDLSTFDTSNVTDMYNMFDGCGYYSEHEFDLSSFDMSSVTNCANMFSNNNKLKTLKTPETSNIENIELPHMFYGPTGLEYTTLPKTAGESIALTTTFTATLSNAHDLFGNIDAEGVLHITGTGSQLNIRLVDAIENVTLRNSITRISFDAGSIESIGDSWAKDTDIAGQLTLPNSVVTIGNDAFNDCKFTGALKLPVNLVTVGDRAFYSTSFTSIELNNKLTTIGADAFKYCDQLNTGSLIIPNSVTTIKSGAFSGIPINKFYVGKNVETLGTNVFDSSSAYRTKLYTNSAVVKNYDWASGNRTIVPMNTFTVSVPEDITLTPKYVAGSAAPVWYASFDIVVTGEFDNGSYGSYEKLASFTIKSEDGETRTVTTNIENTTINKNGTTTISVEIMSPNPTLLKDFTGELKLNTTLHEVIPFAA